MSVAAAVSTIRPAATGFEAVAPTQTLAQQSSVIIVAYNSGGFLQDLVASIYYTEPAVEVVIVDNASTDGAVYPIEAEYPAVQIVRAERNLGFGAGNNLGAARASRPYLVFLNHDTVVVDGWLEALVGPLVVDPSIGLVTPKVLLRSDPERINVAGLNVHLSGLSLCRGLGAPCANFDRQAEVAAISGVAFACRRDLFEALGGFDEDFFLYMEDVDLSLRTWLAGYRCLYVPRAVVLHDYSLELDSRKTFWVERGRYLVLLKAFRPRTLLGLLPTLFLAEVITWGWILWRNPGAAVQKLRAWGWVLTHRTRVAERRRRVQACRAVPDTVFLDRCQWRLDFGQLSGQGTARAAEILFRPLLRVASGVSYLVMQRRGA